jgi:hypothetical protein
MDPITSSLSSMQESAVGNQIQVAVLKKAMDAQAQSALSLIQSIPQASSTNLPAHLGQNVNTQA